MTVQIHPFTVQLSAGQNCELLAVRSEKGIAEYDFKLTWTAENAARDDSFTLSWWQPVEGMHYKWDAPCRLHRSVYLPWDDRFPSMISKNAPITCFFDGENQNRYTWALSECQKLVEIKNVIDDGIGKLHPSFTVGTRQYTGRLETQFTLRIDTRPVTMRQAVADTARWWAEELGMTPAQVPDAAKLPTYSFWYSYHQDVNERNVEEECRRAKEAGFDVCIVDDGWQVDDCSGGYASCGDWEPVPSKFPDMAAHVARVHEIGMKYVLWFSVPFMGHNARQYPHFQSMLLRDLPGVGAGVLDPRYREVREYLLNIYKSALVNWDLDGFKLDFIDEWRDDPENAPYCGQMDIPALQDAVEELMLTIMRELKAIKPDILLEFRQEYIGPHMKRFGNMFRVGDCGGDYLKNRSVMLDLRMTMGNQAVHSDMLALPVSETPENNALQIVSTMFGVLQYSGRLESQSEETKAMARFWVGFLKEHRALLQEGELQTYEAHLLYTWAKSTLGSECAVGVYGIDTCVRPDPVDTIYIANGCAGKRVLLELEGGYDATVLDCKGQAVEAFRRDFTGISAVAVPVGGMLVLKKN